MEYMEFFGRIQESIYARIPRGHEAWENDVWEGIMRPQVVEARKRDLRSLLSNKPTTDRGIAVFTDIRGDIFGQKPDGTSRMGIPDLPEASVLKHLPIDLSDEEPGDVLEAFDIAISQSSYKLHKWGSVTQVTALGNLCSTIDARHAAEYTQALTRLIGETTRAAATLMCDAETKPNYATMQRRVKLFVALKRIGIDLWDVLPGADDMES